MAWIYREIHPPPTQAQEVYVKLCISVHAPTILLPVGSQQAFMVDLGRLQVENQARQLGQGVTIDAFDISLEQFKVSRFA